ncbi:MAG: ABC transporter substrate-binding protein [Candidatus Krumholzibacteriota bacterium]|nr:ABC transporter substrate-binding protein [Candidatus Krumholzibacteriota bacterium]
MKRRVGFRKSLQSRSFSLFLLMAILAFLVSHLSFSSGLEGAGGDKALSSSPDRIISLSPSSTEILYALGLEDRLVGVTRFCKFPPGVSEKPKVGGYLDPNYEIIALLKPDMVILLPEQDAAGRYLDQLRIAHMTVDNKTIEDILASIRMIGEICGVDSAAVKLVSSLESRIDSVRTRVLAGARPRIMITIGRDFGSDSLGKIYIAGRKTYYDEIIDIAGGVNACGERMIKYPVISAEGVLAIDPDMIIELLPEKDAAGYTEEEINRPWKGIPNARAVRGKKIYLLTQDYTQIPGPRFIMLLEDIAGIINSE